MPNSSRRWLSNSSVMGPDESCTETLLRGGRERRLGQARGVLEPAVGAAPATGEAERPDGVAADHLLDPGAEATAQDGVLDGAVAVAELHQPDVPPEADAATGVAEAEGPLGLAGEREGEVVGDVRRHRHGGA